ncbi:sigma factor-like helix-turn-helix DNA-binding protein [Escherichia coli]
MCRMEELTYAQAARRMGVTVHAIEKHMTAAMAQLSKALGSD